MDNNYKNSMSMAIERPLDAEKIGETVKYHCDSSFTGFLSCSKTFLGTDLTLLPPFSKSSNMSGTQQSDEPIPIATIVKILQTSAFTNRDTKITAPAAAALQRYMELFVREAVFRSAENKDGAKDPENSFTGVRVEVDHLDLEHIAGLLLLDMS